jgi:YgiT-type zinc finger domain-containing protein
MDEKTKNTMSNKHKELCAVCGHETRKTTITHEEQRNGHFYLFQDVPAFVCTSCGEIWIEETTLKEIDRLIKEGEPIRMVETPVFDLAGVK